MVTQYPTLLSLLDSAFAVTRAHAKVLLPVSLVYDGLAVGLVEVVMPIGDPTGAPLTFINYLIVTGVLGFFGAYAVSSVLWSHALGRTVDVGSAILLPWREARWALPAALAIAAVQTVGVFLLVIPALLAAVFLLVAAPVAAAEHLGPIQVIGRAFALGAGHRWRALGLVALLILGSTLVGSAQGALGESDNVASLLLGGLLMAPVALFCDVTVFLLYGDLRVRKETIDLELLAREVEGSS